MFQRQSKDRLPIIIHRPRKRRIPVTIPTSGFMRQNSSRSFRRNQIIMHRPPRPSSVRKTMSRAGIIRHPRRQPPRLSNASKTTNLIKIIRHQPHRQRLLAITTTLLQDRNNLAGRTGIRTSRGIDLRPPDLQNAAPENFARRFCFRNISATGKIPAWESRCGNSSK
jgi:hypothetical protein